MKDSNKNHPDPWGDESLLLQLLFYQKRLNLRRWPQFRRRTPYPYETWFLKNRVVPLKEKSPEEIEAILQEAARKGLTQSSSAGVWSLTGKGTVRTYGIIQYVTQTDDPEFLSLTRFMDPVAKQGFRIADVGCGSGIALMRFVRHYRARGAAPSLAMGLDLDEEALNFARELSSEIAPEATFRQGNAMKLPFEEKSMDILFSSIALHLLNRKAFLQEARRVLDREGRLILITTSMGSFLRSALFFLLRGRFGRVPVNLFALFNGLVLHATGRQPAFGGNHLHAESASSLSRALKENGFRVITCAPHRSRFSLDAILAVAVRGE